MRRLAPNFAKQMTAREHEALVSALKPLLDRGNYKSALVLAKRALKKFPDDFSARYQYAKLLGDWADELPASRQAKLKRHSVRILKPLLKRLRGRPVDERFGLCLNYYYQSKDWRGMISFGRRFAATGQQQGLYAQALGSTLLAGDLHDEKRASAAWAKKSVKVWRKYDLRRETYYFKHYSFAKALALAGEHKEALTRLKIAARLGRRKVDDWEFADVLKLLSKFDV